MGERKFQRSNGVDDLVLLEEVTADSIVDNLRMRFTKDLIYSYIGPVLVRLMIVCQFLLRFQRRCGRASSSSASSAFLCGSCHCFPVCVHACICSRPDRFFS